MATRPYAAHDVTLPAGHSLRYYEWGNSSTNLVLLHGSYSYALQWDRVAEHLAPEFHVFAIDQRGHGDSGRPDGEYSAEEYAADVHQFVDTLGLGQIVIGGNSLGGRVAQVFAAEYPRQCTAAVILALHLSNFFQDRDRMAHVLQAACAMLQSPTEFASRDEAYAYWKQTRGERETDAFINQRVDHGMDEVSGKYRVKHDTVRVAQGLAHMAKNLRPYAARVDCPVVIVRSTVDSDISPAQAAELAALWKNGQTVDVEGGYTLFDENPAGTAAAINTFIANVSSVGASV